MILEIKEPCGHSSVYGYDNISEWLSDIVMAHKTNETLDDFIPMYLAVKVNGQYLNIIDEGRLTQDYQTNLKKIKSLSEDELKIGNIEKIVINETEKDMLIVL